MIASEIVNHLANTLPKLSDAFTGNFAVTSLTSAGTIATATTSANHGLNIGDQVYIRGAQTPIAISTLTRTGTIATVTTDADHDLTEYEGATVEIDGAVEPEFNGLFPLLTVDNRRVFTFTIADTGATNATGAPLLLNGFNVFDSYNGLREVSATPTTTSFEYTLSQVLHSPASGSIEAGAMPRISSTVDIESAIRAYTKQPTGDAWLMVVLGDAVANRSRRTQIDSTDLIYSDQFYDQRLIQGVSFYVFYPCSETIAGSQARDVCEQLLRPICQSVLGKSFSSLVEGTSNPLMLVGHGSEAYNGAVYIHRYDFEATLLMGASDIYQPDDSVAFRDIALDMCFAHGSQNITNNINLDDKPL